jgi:hypothetical protein
MIDEWKASVAGLSPSWKRAGFGEGVRFLSMVEGGELRVERIDWPFLKCGYPNVSWRLSASLKTGSGILEF